MKTNKPTEEWKRKNGVTPKDGEKLKYAKKKRIDAEKKLEDAMKKRIDAEKKRKQNRHN